MFDGAYHESYFQSAPLLRAPDRRHRVAEFRVLSNLTQYRKGGLLLQPAFSIAGRRDGAARAIFGCAGEKIVLHPCAGPAVLIP